MITFLPLRTYSRSQVPGCARVDSLREALIGNPRIKNVKILCSIGSVRIEPDLKLGAHGGPG